VTLSLDARQRAMLAEMGIRTWGPPSAPARAPEARRVVAAASVADAPGAIAAPPHEARAPASREAVPFAPGAHHRSAARPAVDALAWPELRARIASCTACPLCEGRRNTVPGSGDLQADWLVVGEAPGEGEDLSGEPFAGQEGILLDNMLRALGLARGTKVYLTQALKCRAPANRSPEPAEVVQCEAYLRRQVELLQPRVILALGRLAAAALVPGNEPLGKLRGRVHSYQGVPVVVSYAPAYLLRNLPEKARAWADLCLAQSVIDGTAS
jgi:uracil-DNA glycosylase